MATFQHYLNSLHIFCRLRSLGFSKKTAIRLSRLWEKVIHPLVYPWASRTKPAYQRVK
ncbi:MAG: hypothetical protein HY954_07870 [Deltaproteobacteria bacterium]|nr:hypothetical protein [Deltaproteobacteria bacterium]